MVPAFRRHRELLAGLAALVLAGTLDAQVPRSRSDPIAGPPTAALAAALPASAFLPAKAVLAKLEGVDPREQRLVLASLESTTMPKTAERAEFVRIRVDLTPAAPDATSSRATLAEWIEALKHEKAVVLAAPVEAEAAPNRMRVVIEWDPSKAPARTVVARDAREPESDPTSYVELAACADKVEVGNLRTASTTRRIPETDWIQERLSIASQDPKRTFHRVTIHNFATVLESRHPYASVSRYALLSAPDAGARKRMELEVTILHPAPAEDLEPANGKR